MVALKRYVAAVRSAELARRSGRVSQFFGEVVGLKDGKVLLMPYGDLRGIAAGSEVIATGRPVGIPIGEGLLGRVIDAFGRALDGKPARGVGTQSYFRLEPHNPLARSRIRDVM